MVAEERFSKGSNMNAVERCRTLKTETEGIRPERTHSARSVFSEVAFQILLVQDLNMLSGTRCRVYPLLRPAVQPPLTKLFEGLLTNQRNDTGYGSLE